MKITDEMLYTAAEDAAKLWLSTLPDASSLPEPRYSLRYKWKMRKLFRQAERTIQPKRRIRNVRKTVMIAVAAMAVLFSMLMSVQAYRERIIDAIVTVYHELTQYRFVNETGYQAELPEIVFGFIPEGMSLMENDRRPNRNYILYEAEDGSFMELAVTRITAQSAYEGIVDSEDAIVKDIVIRGASATLYSKNGEHIILWVESNTVCRLTGNIDLETLIMVTENISFF